MESNLVNIDNNDKTNPIDENTKNISSCVSLNKAAHLLGCNELNKFDYKSLNSIRKLAKTLGCNEYDLMKSFNNLNSLLEIKQEDNLVKTDKCEINKIDQTETKLLNKLKKPNISKKSKTKSNDKVFKRTIINKKLPSKLGSLKSKKAQKEIQQQIKYNNEIKNSSSLNYNQISQKREVILYKDENLGFGFIAGSEKPLKIRFVTPEGPGKNKLLNGDEILAVNDQDVEFASRDFVISLIRSSTDKLKLIVKQPTPKSNNSLLLTEDKKALKKEINLNKKNKVRFRLDVNENHYENQEFFGRDENNLKKDHIQSIEGQKIDIKKENDDNFNLNNKNETEIIVKSDKIEQSDIEDKIKIENVYLNNESNLNKIELDEQKNDNMSEIESIQQEDFSILRVYLETNTIKSFKYDRNTLVKDVLNCLKEKLFIKTIESFGLVIRFINEIDLVSKYVLINETQHLYKLKEDYGENSICMLRFLFVPNDYKDLIEFDENAFNYLYLQSINDVTKERFGSEIKYEMILHLTTLSILHEHCLTIKPEIDASFLENECDLEKFLPKSLLESNLLKRDDLNKLLAQNLNWFMDKIDLLNQISLKYEYLICMKELLQFSGRIFFVYLLDQMKETFIIIGSEYGLATFIDIKTKTLFNLAKFESIENIRVSNNVKLNLIRVDLDLFEINIDNEEENIINKTLSFGFLKDDYIEFLYALQGYLRLIAYPIKNRICPIQEIKSTTNLNENLNIPVYLVKHPCKNQYQKAIQEHLKLSRLTNSILSIQHLSLYDSDSSESSSKNLTNITTPSQDLDKTSTFDSSETIIDNHENNDIIQKPDQTDSLEEDTKAEFNLKEKLHEELLSKFYKKLKSNNLEEDKKDLNDIKEVNEQKREIKNDNFKLLSYENISNNTDDDIIDYEGNESDDNEEDHRIYLKNLNILNNLDNESLALIESFHMTIQNEEHNDDIELKSDVKNKTKTILQIKNENKVSENENKNEDDIKSISSIEGSLKGLSLINQNSSGLNSSTPLIHLYPKLEVQNSTCTNTDKITKNNNNTNNTNSWKSLNKDQKMDTNEFLIPSSHINQELYSQFSSNTYDVIDLTQSNIKNLISAPPPPEQFSDDYQINEFKRNDCEIESGIESDSSSDHNNAVGVTQIVSTVIISKPPPPAPPLSSLVKEFANINNNNNLINKNNTIDNNNATNNKNNYNNEKDDADNNKTETHLIKDKPIYSSKLVINLDKENSNLNNSNSNAKSVNDLDKTIVINNNNNINPNNTSNKLTSFNSQIKNLNTQNNQDNNNTTNINNNLNNLIRRDNEETVNINKLTSLKRSCSFLSNLINKNEITSIQSTTNNLTTNSNHSTKLNETSFSSNSMTSSGVSSSSSSPAGKTGSNLTSHHSLSVKSIARQYETCLLLPSYNKPKNRINQSNSIIKIINHPIIDPSLLSKTTSIKSINKPQIRSCVNLVAEEPKLEQAQLIEQKKSSSLLDILFSSNQKNEVNIKQSELKIHGSILHTNDLATPEKSDEIVKIKISNDLNNSDKITNAISKNDSILLESNQTNTNNSNLNAKKKTNAALSFQKVFNRLVETTKSSKHKINDSNQITANNNIIDDENHSKFELINGFDDTFIDEQTTTVKDKNKKKSLINKNSLTNDKKSVERKSSYSISHSLPSRNFKSILDLFKHNSKNNSTNKSTPSDNDINKTDEVSIDLEKSDRSETKPEIEPLDSDLDIKFKVSNQHEDSLINLFKNLDLIEDEQIKESNGESKNESVNKIKSTHSFNNDRFKNLTTFTSGFKKGALKDPQSGKSSLKVRWKDSIEISNILIEDKDEELDDDEDVNDVYTGFLDEDQNNENLFDGDQDEDDDDNDDEEEDFFDEKYSKKKFDDNDDESIDSSDLEIKSNRLIKIDKKLPKETEKIINYKQLEEFNLKPLHSIGIEFENEMLERIEKLKNISEKIFKIEDDRESEHYFNEIFTDLDSVLFELHLTIEHVRLSSMITIFNKLKEEDIKSELFKRNLDENLNEIALICREFVHNSKTMISSSLIDEKAVRPHVRTGMNSLSLLVEKCFEICFKYIYKNEKLDEIRQLLIQILNLLNTFRNTLNITYLAATKQLNDTQMSLLMKQAHSLANEISLLIKHFKLVF